MTRELVAATLLDRALAVVSESVLIADARAHDTPIVYVSETFERLTGYPPSEVLGRNCRFLQGPGTDPGAVGRLREAVASGRPEQVVLLNYRKDGTPFFNEVSLEAVRDGAGELTHLIGVQHDVTDRVQSRALWAAGRGVTEVLTAWDEHPEGLAELVARLGGALGWEAGGLWTAADEPHRLTCQGFWTRPGEGLEAFGEQARQVPVQVGAGPVGRAWQGRELAVAELLAPEDPAASPVVAEAGLCSAMALPLTYEGDVLAVLALWAREPRTVDAEARTALELLGDTMGAFLHRHRGLLVPGTLSPREVEVLQLAAQGEGVAEIAATLCIATGTVRTHFKNIYDRLGVRDRAAAVAEGLRLGLLR